MIVYSYSATTGEYTGSRTAQPSPLEPGAFLIPANATAVEPPTAEAGKAVTWNGAAWTQVDDNRGMVFWTPAEGLATQSALGPLPPGANVVTDDLELRQLSDGTWTDAPMSNAERAALITLPRLTFEGALAAALAAGGADVLPRTVIAYADGVLAADANLTDDEREMCRFILGSASAFWRGDPEIVVAPDVTAGELLNRAGAVFGFGAGALGPSPSWSERIAAASAAIDLMFIAAEDA